LSKAVLPLANAGSHDAQVRNFVISCSYMFETSFPIELFHLPTSMHNSLFINNMYVTLLSSTCFEN